jgi:hypothetical protein
MSSVPDGRAANHPLAALTFTPPMGAPLPGALVRMLRSGAGFPAIELAISGNIFASAMGDL